MNTILILPLLLALAQQTPTSLLDQIDAATKALRELLAPPLTTTERLQAALLKGGTLDLLEGQVYDGFVVSVPGTTVNGHGAVVHATGLGLWVTASNVTVRGLTVQTTSTDTAIRCGANDSSQTAVSQMPVGVVLEQLTVPLHHGKRGIEVNCAGVVQDNVLSNVWDHGQDSQGIAVLNSVGPVQILRNTLTAIGSEGILLGGDLLKLPGELEQVLIEGNTITRPVAWMTGTTEDKSAQKVKNGIEVKRGRHVIVRNNHVDVVYAGAGQDGWAFVITPRAGGDIHDVLFERNVATNVGGCFNILGQDTANIQTPAPLSGVVLRGNDCTMSKLKYGGRGQFALIVGEPADITITQNLIDGDGTSFVNYDPGKVLSGVDAVTQRPGGPIASLTITDNLVGNAGSYGVFLAGVANGGPSPAGATVFVMTGNTIALASATLKKNQPVNTYVDRPTYEALAAVKRAVVVP
jgi:hypothetical protein